MKKYSVTIPIAGSITIILEAESDNEAIDKALEIWPFDAETTRFTFDRDEVEWPGHKLPWLKDAWLNELESYEKIVEGNVCYVNCWEASVEEE